MYCPHCGVENDDANRFCVGCGSDLSKRSSTDSAPISFRHRLGLLFGTTRQARLLSAGTAVALVIALIAFIALRPSKEGIPQDSYLRELDRSCVAEKRRISNLEAETLRERSPNLEAFASVLVTIIAEWRSNLRSTPPPPIHAEGLGELESALLGILIEAGTLARLARERASAHAVTSRAEAVEEATKRVEGAIDGLGLERCSNLSVGVAAAGS